jgi:cytidylate kinase
MSEGKRITIAIDGPAGSGKSTTARKVAEKLAFTYIDSGAMYRAVTLKALREKVPVHNELKVAELAEKIKISFDKSDDATIIYMNGEDVSDEIRTPAVDQNISPVAANPKVRQILVGKQQKLGKKGGVVMDGRDIGTVVFPEAELKIFMLASVQERARRRLKDMEQKGIQINLDKVVGDIRHRDRQDASRHHGPLKKAEDAVEIDTTDLSIAEQVDKIVKLARNIMGG